MILNISLRKTKNNKIMKIDQIELIINKKLYNIYYIHLLIYTFLFIYLLFLFLTLILQDNKYNQKISSNKTY